jgi:putative nucleotidyltransferase with HDIG domain
MLILTDRAKGGLAIYNYLIRGRRCHVVPLHQAQAQSLKHPIIVCDVDIGNMTSVRLLRAALKLHRVDADIPVLFLTRDSSRLTAALAISLDATELVYCNESPAVIHAAAERLICAYQSRNKGAARPASVTEARASEAKSALAGYFDAVKRGEPVSIEEVDRGVSVVLGAIKQAKIRSWLDVVWQFDDVTYQHCLLVAGLGAAFSLKWGLTSNHQHLLLQAALLHDVGKARLPPAILNKSGALSKPEMDVMRTHPALGHAMLAGQRGISPVILDVIRHHHEYLDGTGYPDRLQGRQISDYVRIVTICDIYAALIERRPYKAPMPPQQALAVLTDLGVKLDRNLLTCFEAVVADSG